MVKVITAIGAVVEVDEAIYENNKDSLKLFEPETHEKSTEESVVKNTAMKKVKNTAIK